MKSLEDYVRSQISIEETELQTILANFEERRIAKGKFLLKHHHIATDYFFITSGALRIYFEHNDKQITGWIALENEFFTELSSLKNQTPSRFNIQAIEETVLLTIEKCKMEQLYRQFPKWQEFGRLVWETAFLKVIDGIITFQTMTSGERYLKTMRESNLLQRVPLKELSSFLGITPTSLSRLRKNIK